MKKRVKTHSNVDSKEALLPVMILVLFEKPHRIVLFHTEKSHSSVHVWLILQRRAAMKTLHREMSYKGPGSARALCL